MTHQTRAAEEAGLSDVCVGVSRRHFGKAPLAATTGFLLSLLLTCCALSAQSEEHRVRNIVLVHGAWADGSGWKGVYDILLKDGFNVSIVEEPLTSFQEDVAATKRVIALQNGLCILVAHSY
jgi:hypothetical protein